MVLLGEKHDNEDHHRIQALTVKQIYARGRRPAIAFEMFTDRQRASLNDHLASHPRDADGIAAAVGWPRTGWSDWSQYRPIAQAAVDHDQRILAAGLSRRTLRARFSGASGEATPPTVDRGLPDHLQLRLRAVIRAGHCNQISATMIETMITMQMTKDAHMAAALREGLRGTDSAILVAGGGHVRKDFGVPWHLADGGGEPRVVSLALMEVVAGLTRPDDYGKVFETKALPFDYVWFTPRRDDRDPCDAFLDELRRIREHRAPAAKAN